MLIPYSSHFELFSDGYYLLLQTNRGTNNKKRKKSDKERQLMNDPRVPSMLKPFIFQEKLTPLEKGWVASGRQLRPKSFPSLQQRYCTPNEENENEEYDKRAAIYTIANGKRRQEEDVRYRILHVYDSRMRRGRKKRKSKSHRG